MSYKISAYIEKISRTYKIDEIEELLAYDIVFNRRYKLKLLSTEECMESVNKAMQYISKKKLNYERLQ